MDAKTGQQISALLEDTKKVIDGLGKQLAKLVQPKEMYLTQLQENKTVKEVRQFLFIRDSLVLFDPTSPFFFVFC